MTSGLGLLWGCGTTGPNFQVRDDPWRSPEERACLASGAVQQTAFVRARSALGGPSVCGAESPFEMSAADRGRVALIPAASLRCPMIPQIDRWVKEVVEPAARYNFRQELSGVKVLASYSCRPMNSVEGAMISEHAYANAVDIGGFVLADGSTIIVKRDWNGSPREQAFLRSVHDGACEYFTTVLGPNYNSLHSDHFHLDLAHHGRDGLMHICK
ncbi:extensin family protein [Hyphomicrobium sp.]|uniref:extensin-like domain-containing protein n=1 Tax=Hyphomicrobium sp. TaxID=82 RepID=UPI0025BA3D56|nr:extensin family protein [Hyphomicrobium sp.]